MPSQVHTHAYDPTGPKRTQAQAHAVLARAESLCEQQGLRLTPIRRRVLEELGRERQPMSAYLLADRLSSERPVAPIAVYRALDFLAGAGLVRRVASKSAYVLCEQGPASGTAVLLICKGCGLVDEVVCEGLGRELNQAAALVDFAARKPTIELEGECASCSRR
jgi:Fur family zinc uptake transcriptional regulator